MSCASEKQQSHRVGRISLRLRHTHYAKVVNNYGAATVQSSSLFPMSLTRRSGLQHLSNALVSWHERDVREVVYASVIACLL